MRVLLRVSSARSKPSLGRLGPGSADPIWCCMYIVPRANFGVEVVWYNGKVIRMVRSIVKRMSGWRGLMRRKIAEPSVRGHLDKGVGFRESPTNSIVDSGAQFGRRHGKTTLATRNQSNAVAPA